MEMKGTIERRSSYEIYDLRCDYRDNPAGVRCDGPCFSWKTRFSGVCHGFYQRAYQIRLWDVKNHEIWDSGKVESEKQWGIPCQGSLRPHTRYFWSVRIWDERGEASRWSQKQQIITALGEEDWLGDWITYDGIDAIYPFRDHVWLRRSVILDTKPREVFLYVASLGYHDLYINGEKVSDTVFSPARGCLRGGRVTVNYRTYDIAAFLREGTNVIGIAMDAGFSRMNADLSPALLVQAYGSGFEFHSDAAWVCAANGNQYLGAFRWGDYGGEKTVVPAWETAWSTKEWDISAWHAVGILPVNYRLREQAVEPDRIVEVIEPVDIKGEKELLVDMGRNFTGWLGLRLPELQKEIVIEVSDKREARCAFHQRLVYGPGLGHGGWYYSQFNYVSGRFFTITGLEAPLEKGDIRGLVISSAMERRGRFSCEQELLQQIYETDLYTYQASTIGGVTTDCPHRERLGYGETGASTTWADGLLNFDMGAFYRNYLLTWADTQRADGYFAHTAPDYPGGGGTVWSSYPVIGCRDFYRYFGDRAFLARLYPSLLKWTQFLMGHEKDGLLERYEFEEWDFLGDWATPDGDDWGNMETALYFNNCCYAYVLRQMEEFAQILEKAGDCKIFRARHRAVSCAIDGKFWKLEGYFCKRDGRYQAAALAAGVVSVEKAPDVEREMLKIIEEKQYLDGGSAGTILLLRLLSQTDGGNRLIYKWMCKKDIPGYGYFLSMGETTWPEMWDMRNVYGASRIHTCYTGCAGWFVEGLCGVRVSHKGIRIKPFIPEDLGWAQCETDTLWGKAACRWEKQEETVLITITIPFSAKATLEYKGCQTELHPGEQKYTFTLV